MRKSTSPNRRRLVIFVAALTIPWTLLAGCEKPEPPPVAYIGPTLASSDLGVEETTPAPTGFTLLEQQTSQGRFPCALAIARLMPPQGFFTPDNNNVSKEQWSISTIKWEEAMNWNRLGNKIPDIREVIVLDRLTTVRPGCDVKMIAATARRLEAALCLVYGPSPAEPECAGLCGVILDTQSASQVAFIQAQAGPSDFEPPHADRREEDMRHRDPNYLVQKKFQRQVRQCMLSLIQRDVPPTTTQPSPWQTGKLRPAVTPVYVVPQP